MTTSNRSIKTSEGFAPGAQMITLEVLRDTEHRKAGDTVEVTKSEARRLLQSSKDLYRVKID